MAGYSLRGKALSEVVKITRQAEALQGLAALKFHPENVERVERRLLPAWCRFPRFHSSIAGVPIAGVPIARVHCSRPLLAAYVAQVLAVKSVHEATSGAWLVKEISSRQ